MPYSLVMHLGYYDNIARKKNEAAKIAKKFRKSCNEKSEILTYLHLSQ